MTLLDGGDRILKGWDADLAREGLEILRARGLDVLLECRVNDFRDGELLAERADREPLRLPMQTLVWTAGTRAASAPLVESGLSLGPAGRLAVDETLRAEGHERIYAAGDVVHLPDMRTGAPYPPVAPIAISQGVRAAANIENAVAGRPLEPYRAHHAGKVVSLGAGKALADILSWRSRGRMAWFIYRAVTLLELVGTRNKLRTVTSLLLHRLFGPSDIYD